MRCSACGHETGKTDAICSVCGKKIRNFPEKKTESMYRVSKMNVFISILLFLAIAVAGYCAVKVNRDIIGEWEYADENGFFSANKSATPEHSNNSQIQEESVRLVISETQIELFVGKKSKGKTEYTFSEDTINGKDGKTNLKLDWEIFSLNCEGSLFDYGEVSLKKLERKDSAEHTLKNMVFIVIIAVLVLILVFVGTSKKKKTTRKMGSFHDGASAAVQRTAIRRKSTEVASSEVVSGYDLDIRHGKERKAVKNSASGGEISFDEYFRKSEAAYRGSLRSSMPLASEEELSAAGIKVNVDRSISSDSVSEKSSDKKDSGWFNSAGDL